MTKPDDDPHAQFFVPLKNAFRGCSKLQTIAGLAGWSVGKVKDFSGLFRGAAVLEIDGTGAATSSGDVAGWDVGAAT